MEKEKNPFFSIVELTEQFKKIQRDELTAMQDFQLSFQLAQAQQLAVIAGHLKDLVAMLKEKI